MTKQEYFKFCAEYGYPEKEEDFQYDINEVIKNEIEKFIKEIKDEFKDQNWDYLDYIKDRVLNKPVTK